MQDGPPSDLELVLQARRFFHVLGVWPEARGGGGVRSHVSGPYSVMTWNAIIVASFPGPRAASVARKNVLQATKSWAGPGNEATIIGGSLAVICWIWINKACYKWKSSSCCLNLSRWFSHETTAFSTEQCNNPSF